MKKYVNIVKEAAIMASIIYFVMTIASSCVGLYYGELTDTHLHLIIRAVFVFAGVLPYYMLKNSTTKNIIVKLVVPYLVSLSLVLIFTFLTSLIDTVTMNGYIDAIINFSVIYLIVTVVVLFDERSKKNK